MGEGKARTTRTMATMANMLVLICLFAPCSSFLHAKLPSSLSPSKFAGASCSVDPVPGIGMKMVGSDEGAKVMGRKDMLKNAAVWMVTAWLFAGDINVAHAQRPPPRPKLRSVPEECKQSGACGGMMQDEDNLPAFASSSDVKEVLDPKDISTGDKYTADVISMFASEVYGCLCRGRDGPAIGPDSFVSVQYVLRRSNGYFVDASYGFD
eukprot:761501-Hanusia_phi.AAC.1